MKQVTDFPLCRGAMVEMAGQKIQCRIGGEQTGGALAVLEVTLGPGLLGAPPHMHRKEDEVLIVIEGEMMVQVGERVVQALPGEFVFKPRGVRHAFWNPGATPTRFLEFITPSGFEEFFREVAPLFPPDRAPDVNQAVELGRRYEVDFDLSRVSEILTEHSVKPAWMGGASLPEDHTGVCSISEPGAGPGNMMGKQRRSGPRRWARIEGRCGKEERR